MFSFLSLTVCKLIWSKGVKAHPQSPFVLQGGCGESTEKCKHFQQSLPLDSSMNAIKIYLLYNPKKGQELLA